MKMIGIFMTVFFSVKLTNNVVLYFG